MWHPIVKYSSFKVMFIIKDKYIIETEKRSRCFSWTSKHTLRCLRSSQQTYTNKLSFYYYLLLLLLPSLSLLSTVRISVCLWSLLVSLAPTSLSCTTSSRSLQTSTVLGLYCRSCLVVLLFGYYSKCCFLFVSF
jgi:hypothetical protein